jgi:hypothetical protein
LKFKMKSLVKGCALLALTASMNVYAEGNRYDLPRNYHSEISAAKAYILTNLRVPSSKGFSIGIWTTTHRQISS